MRGRTGEKVCPLEANELTSLYPKFDAFRTVCGTLDPQGVFQNGLDDIAAGSRWSCR